MWPRTCGDLGLSRIEVLSETCWEKLHSGSWADVAVVWRDAFAGMKLVSFWLHVYSSSCCETESVEDSVKLKGEASLGEDDKKIESLIKRVSIKELDMGLVMGGDEFREMIHATIGRIVPGARETRNRLLLHSSTCPEKGSRLLVTKVFPNAHKESIFQSSTPHGHKNRIPSIECPAGEVFMTQYFLPQCPVILLKIADHWPAMRLWNIQEYWEAVAGRRTVPVEIGKDYMAKEWTQKLMDFSTFLDSLTLIGEKQEDNTSRIYLAQHPLLEQIDQLREDVFIPEYCHLTGEISSINAWIGPPGTVTPAHTDPHHNIFVQIVGYKYIRLYHPSCSSSLYPDQEGLTSNTSTVDIDNVDEDAFPLFSQLEYYHCILGPGESLFIPKGWWHYVKSLTISASVSIWWD
jgi:lysine-specific demethylase 8